MNSNPLEVICQKCNYKGNVNDMRVTQCQNIKEYDCKDESACRKRKQESYLLKKAEEDKIDYENYVSKANEDDFIDLGILFRDAMRNYYDPVTDMCYCRPIYGGPLKTRKELLEYARENHQ